MNRAEALEHFEEHIAGEACEIAAKEFHCGFLQKRELYINKLQEGFRQIVAYLKDNEDNTSIGYIHFSFLRAHVLDGTYQWYVEAQDEKGVFDKKERSVTIDMAEFFEPLETLVEVLSKKLPDYAGKITQSDVENIKLREFGRYIGYFYIGGLKAFQKIRQQEVYRELHKASLFRITIGERKDKCIILHIAFPEPMEEEEALAKLCTAPEESGMSVEELTFRDFSGFHFQELRLVFKNTAFTSYQNVTMEEEEALFCNFIGCDFTGAVIKNSYLNACTFQDTTFEQAIITDTVLAANHFAVTEYETGKKIVAGVYPVSFRGAVLTNVNFTGSDLRNCDFTGVTFKNVDFTDTNVTGAVFDKNAVLQLNLTKEQLDSICVK